MDRSVNYSEIQKYKRIDRLGILASVLCAIHCALTPFLLIFLPVFGQAWSHPATHWGMALFVIPIAIFMMRKGYKEHGKKWVVVVGSIGVLLLIVGAILPYLETASSSQSSHVTASAETGEKPENDTVG